MRKVNESEMSKAIVEGAARKFSKITENDVIVVGAGPAGLTATKYLAKEGLKTLVIERRLSFGGGIGGGGMQLPVLLIQEPADEILREINCKLEPYSRGLYLADPAEMITKLATSAIDNGADILLGVTVDDVIYRLVNENVRIEGVVIQWTSVITSGLHVDPLALKSKVVIDCTGHDAEVLTIAARKIPDLNLVVPGESSMWIERAEELVIEKTGKACEGLYVAGMSVAALHGLPRMGPVFGGMLLSGKRVAEVIINELKVKRAV